jgi:Tfp pilus assembly protein PilF
VFVAGVRPLPEAEPLPAPKRVPGFGARVPAWAAAAVCLLLAAGGGVLWRSQRAEIAALRVHVAGAHAPASVSEAHSLYVRGRYLMDRESEQSLRLAEECFRQAIALDPQYAAAWAGLADVRDVMAQFRFIPPAQGMEDARHAAEKALSLDPLLAEAHVSLGAILEAYDWNWKGAEREYRRAIELNPNLPATHLWYGMFLRDQGRVKEAMPELEMANHMDPLSVFTLVNLANAYVLNGEPAAAERQLKISIDLAPQSPRPAMMLAGVLHDDNRNLPGLIQSLEHAREADGGSPQSVAALASAYARAGRKQDAAKLVSELQKMSRERYVSPYDVATVYLSMDDVEGALPYLEKAYEERSTGMLFLRRPKFECFRSYPRFRSLVEKMHFNG